MTFRRIFKKSILGAFFLSLAAGLGADFCLARPKDCRHMLVPVSEVHKQMDRLKVPRFQLGDANIRPWLRVKLLLSSSEQRRIAEAWEHVNSLAMLNQFHRNLLYIVERSRQAEKIFKLEKVSFTPLRPDSSPVANTEAVAAALKIIDKEFQDISGTQHITSRVEDLKNLIWATEAELLNARMSLEDHSILVNWLASGDVLEHPREGVKIVLAHLAAGYHDPMKVSNVRAALSVVRRSEELWAEYSSKRIPGFSRKNLAFELEYLEDPIYSGINLPVDLPQINPDVIGRPATIGFLQWLHKMGWPPERISTHILANREWNSSKKKWHMSPDLDLAVTNPNFDPQEPVSDSNKPLLLISQVKTFELTPPNEIQKIAKGIKAKSSQVTLMPVEFVNRREMVIRARGVYHQQVRNHPELNELQSLANTYRIHIRIEFNGDQPALEFAPQPRD